MIEVDDVKGCIRQDKTDAVHGAISAFQRLECF